MRRILLIVPIVFFIGIANSVAQNESSNLIPFAMFDTASEAVLSDPHDLTLGPDNRLYVADKFNNRIVVMDKETLKEIDSFGENELSSPRDISFASDGKAYIADTNNNRVAIYSFSSGKAELVGSLSEGISQTEGAAAHPNGRIYATGAGTSNIVAYQNGNVVEQFFGIFGAHDVEVGPDGNVWVADTGNARIVKFSPDLKVLDILDDAGYGWIGPRYLDFDKAGRLIVADQDAHRAVLIDRKGAIVGVIGDGTPGVGPNKFDDPEGVEIVGPEIYISDSDNNRIVRYLMVTN